MVVAEGAKGIYPHRLTCRYSIIPDYLLYHPRVTIALASTDMSLIDDHAWKIDTVITRIQLSQKSAASSPSIRSHSTTASITEHHWREQHTLQRLKQLRGCVRIVSTLGVSRTELGLGNVLLSLERARLSEAPQWRSSEEKDLEWLLISKATVQVYRSILLLLLTHTLQMEHDVRYWDDVLSSYLYTGLYSIQMAPWRAWRWGKDVCSEAYSKIDFASRKSFTTTWREFYGHVHDSIMTRSMSTIKATAISPLTLLRGDIRRKRASLKRFREIKAVSLGVLMNDALSFDINEQASAFSGTSGEDPGTEDWKGILARSVALMEAVLRHGQAIEHSPVDFEDLVFSEVENDTPLHDRDGELIKCRLLSERLRTLIRVSIPTHVSASQQFVGLHGRPPANVRYWLPAATILLSSTTLMKVFLSRKAQIYAWITEAGDTVLDFWSNWVLEPLNKIMGTIRHDENTELALMSKSSLKGDRESLERMVVSFAKDKDAALSEAQLQNISMKVNEGDLTPVLMAYESEMRRPFIGTVRGDLIRALLIQVQKTKVDIEVAVGGIDALLKSQQLVFGFIGLTPGVLVCITTFRWISGIWGTRRSLGGSKRVCTRALRNIDKILSDAHFASTAGPGLLSNREYGLLLCELQLLRQEAIRLVPNELWKGFLEDMGQLVDIRIILQHQIRVVDRIRWTYGANWS